MKKIILSIFLLTISSFAAMLQDANGKVVKYEDIIKDQKVALIEYVAIWCPDCQEHFDVLKEFSKNKKDVKVILIFTDYNMKEHGYKKGIMDVKEYLKNNDINYTFYYDYKNDMIKQYKIKFLPSETVVFDGVAIKDFDASYPIEDLNYVFRKY